MPDLSTLLQQHVDELSHPPAGGFTGVRIKARRRTQRRAGAATLAALVVVGAVLTGTGTFSGDNPAPTHPSPTATPPPATTTKAVPDPTPTNAAPTVSAAPVALTDTHWRMTSITAFGKTRQVNDEQVYLYVHATIGGWLLREHCQNIAGRETLGQSDIFFTQVKGAGSCAAQPLARAVAEVFHSSLNDRVVGQRLTLVGATGAMTFVAEPQSVPDAPMTTRLWQLTSITTGNSTVGLRGFHAPTPDALWLVFGKGGFLGGVACGMVQGTALPTGHYLDLAGLRDVPADGCKPSAVHAEAKAAYEQLVHDGHVAWTVSGGTLELRGTSTVMRFADKGPASRLQPQASASASG